MRCKRTASLLGLLIFLVGCGVTESVEQPQISLERGAEAGSLTSQGTSNTITFSIESAAAKRASKVAYYIDDAGAKGEAWRVSKKAPFRVKLDTTELENGEHTITALGWACRAAS